MKHLILAILAIACPLSAAAQDTSEADKGYITTLIEDNLSGDERVVNIQGFAGALSSEATIQQLTVADSEGVWLTLDDVTLTWNRSALLRGAIDVEKISAERILVARAPITADAPPTPEAQPFRLPELPVSISLDELAINRIELGDSFLGEPLAFNVVGSASLSGGEGAADIAAARLDGKSGQFAIAGSYANASKQLVLNLDINEGPAGIIAGLADLPGQPALDLKLAGEGPISDFAATLDLQTDGEPRLTGDLTLITADTGSQFDLNIGGNIAPLFAPDYQNFFGPDVQLAARGQQIAGGGYDLTALTLQADKLRLSGQARIDAGGWPERLVLDGAIADDTGDPVLLPLPGAKTFVDRVNLNIGHDQSISDDWSADFNIVGFDRPGLRIAQIALDGGGIITSGTGGEIGAVTANLDYAATGVALDDAGAADALGDAIKGVLVAEYTEGTPFQLNQLTMTGPGLEILAEASVATPDDNLRTTADIILSVAALDRFATLFGRPALAGQAELNVLSTLSPLDGFYDLLITGQTQDLAVGIAQLDPVLAGTGDLSLQAVRDTGGTRVNALRIATPEAEITASADITSGASTASFAAALGDISKALPELNGAANLGGDIIRDDAGKVTFDINAEAAGATLTAIGEAIPAGSGQTISAKVVADVTDLARYRALAGRDLDGAAQMDINAIVLSDGLRFDANVAARTQDLAVDVAQLDPLLAGAGTLTAEISRTGQDRFRVADLRIANPQLDLVANADGALSEAIRGDLDLTIKDAGQLAAGLSGPLDVDLTGDRNVQGQIDIDLTAVGAGSDIRLVGTAAPIGDHFEVTGDLDADIADLAPFATLAARDIAGRLSADISGSGVTDLSDFDADFAIAGQGLAIGDPRIDPILTGDSAVFGTATRSDGGTASATLQARAGGANLQLDATASPVGDQFDVAGTLQAGAETLTPFRAIAGQPLSGSVTADVSGRVMTDLSSFDADLSITSEDFGIGNTSVDQLLRGTGELSAKASRAAGQISLPAFSLRTGTLSASGNLVADDDGTGTAAFEARLADIGLFTDQLSGPVTAQGNATRNAASWGVDMSASGPGGIGAQVNGAIADNGTLDLDMTGNAPLGLANPVLEPRRLSGNATFDLAVNGPAALSSVSGAISTAGARLAAPTLGLALENITGGATLSGSRAEIGISADVPAGGGLRISGPVTLAAPFNGSLSIAVNDLVLQDPNLYRTSVNGTVSLDGALTGGARIAGLLNLGETDVHVPSSGVSGLGELPPITHVGESTRVRTTLNRAGLGAEAAAARADRAGGPGFPLDITVNAPSRIFIRGRGLDAELGGTLNIGGTTNNIVPVGQFDLRRGRIDVLQQRFDLTEGSATLQGDFLPYIRLVAATESRNGTLVRIVIEGPANAPEVTFQSTPDLPQDEVLAQLIFGRNLSEISPLQAVQLAAAVGTLAGRGSGGLIDNFRQGIGLDDFDVTTDAEGNAAVRAGKYLTENVYTDVTINADGETEINLNLDVTDNVTAKGTVDADGETSIGIFFERDY